MYGYIADSGSNEGVVNALKDKLSSIESLKLDIQKLDIQEDTTIIPNDLAYIDFFIGYVENDAIKSLEVKVNGNLTLDNTASPILDSGDYPDPTITGVINVLLNSLDEESLTLSSTGTITLPASSDINAFF
ncbi:MAG: hypothetical protein LBQ24_06020 [Candidatus Peribacteria bacterium]|jgi:hypothetical protein|nr:hypothetical protein [Candidatus Peribacteria bacterium]